MRRLIVVEKPKDEKDKDRQEHDAAVLDPRSLSFLFLVPVYVALR